MKTLTKRIALFLCVAMIIPSILGVLPCISTIATASAATKTTVSDWSKNLTVGIQGTTEYISLDGTKDKAKYTYTSSDKKIVTVSSKGTYATVKGLKEGSATITVKQTLNKKTTKVGTVKVKVKPASLYKESEYTCSIGIPEYQYSVGYFVEYRNTKATYECTSSDPEALEVDKEGIILNAKKTGVVDVAITETYKGVTRNLGNVKVTISAPALDNSTPVKMGTDDYLARYEFLSNAESHEFEVTMTDEAGKDAKDFIEKSYDEEDSKWYGSFHSFEKEGTVLIKVFDKTANMDLGTLTVNISASNNDDSDY